MHCFFCLFCNSLSAKDRCYRSAFQGRYPQTIDFLQSFVDYILQQFALSLHEQLIYTPLPTTPLAPFLLLPLTSLPSSIDNKASLFLSPTTFNASLTTLLSTLTPSSTYSSICLPTLSSIACTKPTSLCPTKLTLVPLRPALAVLPTLCT
jgi:hypothetical protein